ncbi:MAG: DUF4838 domain-containing protein [bacterium]
MFHLHRKVGIAPTLMVCLRFWVIALVAWPTIARAESVMLAENGKAAQPVIVSAQADATVRGAAEDLAGKLSRITGGRFEVEAGAPSTGIYVGLTGEAPVTADDPRFAFDRERLSPDDLATMQSYRLLSHADGLYVLGATPRAVEYAVADLLWRVGYRRFFPTETWEVMPDRPTLEVDLDVHERPDYIDRRMWGGKRPEWDTYNRMTTHMGEMDIHCYHVWQAIPATYPDIFEQHPEYRGLVDGKRVSSKLCVSNPEVRDLMARYAVQTAEKYPQRISISMEPTDGYNWCECENCTALGEISNRAVLAANIAAEAIREQTGRSRWIGILAYAEHGNPPAIEVDPDVAVIVATQLTKGQPFEQRLDGWAERSELVGVYDYYGVYQWWRAMPRKQKLANLGYLQRTIPEFHQRGARIMCAESGGSWGPNGLGFYVASRLLWNVEAADQIDRIVDDFLAHAFGPAEATMREFYGFIDGGQKQPGSAEAYQESLDQVVPMLLNAHATAHEAGRPDVVRRIEDLILWCQYIQFWIDDHQASSENKTAARDALVTFAYRIRNTQMVNWGLVRTFYGGTKHVQPPHEVEAFGLDEPIESDTVTRREIDRVLLKFAERHDLPHPHLGTER